MILADTSVWIDYFNGHLTAHTDTLDKAIIDGLVIMGDLIFLEILQGFRTDKDYKLAKSTLQTLEQFQMLDTKLALKCADNYRLLRKKGITIRRTNDVIIATFCIEHTLPLLFTDRDFLPFVDKLSLKPVLS